MHLPLFASKPKKIMAVRQVKMILMRANVKSISNGPGK
jgi:hypothetical protein